MYRIVTVLSVLCAAVESASYQRYDEAAKYPTYSTYSTISNLYNQHPYKSGSYGSDIATFPEVTRYPNYNPGVSTGGYNTYNTQRSKDAYYQPDGYSTTRYNDVYGQGYSSYEMPFMKDMRDYCINRSPQTGIWVDSLMGMWYGVEFIQHLAGDSRIDYAKVCIVIHISEPMDQSVNHLSVPAQEFNCFSEAPAYCSCIVCNMYDVASPGTKLYCVTYSLTRVLKHYAELGPICGNTTYLGYYIL